MKNFSLKALGAFVFAAGLVFAGVSAPAFATNGAAPTNIVNPGTSTSTSAVTVFWDAVPAGSVAAVLRGTGGISFPTTSNVTVTGTQVYQSCSTNLQIRVDATTAAANRSITCNRSVSGSVSFTGLQPGDVLTAQFASGSMTFAATGTWTAYATYDAFGAAGASIAFTDPNAAPTSYTVTFNGNGSTSGSTASQVSAVPAALTSNGFSKTGYTFTGWNTLANGNGVAFGPGATYGFVANLPLYAQWTADTSGGSSPSSPSTLANTGINSASGISLLAGGLSLALVGAEMFMIARRKRSN